MENLGAAFLALVALFMGGCSLLFIGPTVYECAALQRGCVYLGPILGFAVPILAVALLVGWWSWRIYTR